MFPFTRLVAVAAALALGCGTADAGTGPGDPLGDGAGSRCDAAASVGDGAAAPEAGATVAVPDLLRFGSEDRLSRREARLVLEYLDLGVVVRREIDGGSAGYLIAQDPPAGTVVPRGTAVRLVVTILGVPNVVGQNEADARYRLEGADYDIAVRYEHRGSAAPGTVVAQSPAPGHISADGLAVITVER